MYIITDLFLNNTKKYTIVTCSSSNYLAHDSLVTNQMFY